MSSISGGSIAIIDRDGGDAVTVTDGRLDVNAAITVSSDDINIGNVVLQDDAGTDIYVVAASSDVAPDLDGRNLLGTHALLSARSDANTTAGVTCENSTHNALHVAISDGAGIAHVNASNELEVAIGSINASTFLFTRPIVSTAATNIGVTVGTGSTELIGASVTRLSVVIVNDSDEVMYLAIEDAAVMNTGIRLNPNGGSYTEEMSSDSINAICASGSKNATVCAMYIS